MKKTLLTLAVGLARQHDVHVIHNIPSRHPAQQRHADNAPHQAFEREATLANG
ncbi:hypothetical protein NPS24_26810 [Pseudomonas putida]|nr:hypothetical protein [Pseudomonas putida]MDD1990727.1 hypothetical protein [Pseudomonas putida]